MAGKVFIDCPDCHTGNRFRLGDTWGERSCEDCGFVLAESPGWEAVGLGRCVFCGGEQFFLESPLSLPLLGVDSVCYVCEAKYKGVRVGSPEKYSPETHAAARESEAARQWRERVERYTQGAA